MLSFKDFSVQIPVQERSIKALFFQDPLSDFCDLFEVYSGTWADVVEDVFEL